MRLNAKLSPAKPAGALIVSELHVSPEARGMGIGAALLEHAEVEARRLGTATLALQTLTTNPARHLYERSGFEVRATTSNKSFLQLTGCEGNVLMVKEIAAAPAVNGLEPSR
jgi:ribosomal protein S18 acetylase RimI-like enzyme